MGSSSHVKAETIGLRLQAVSGIQLQNGQTQPNVLKRGISIQFLLQEDIDKPFTEVRHNIKN
jgi:hypothetical protein